MEDFHEGWREILGIKKDDDKSDESNKVLMPDNQPRCKFCDGSKGLPIEANDDGACKACGGLITNRSFVFEPEGKPDAEGCKHKNTTRKLFGKITEELCEDCNVIVLVEEPKKPEKQTLLE